MHRGLVTASALLLLSAAPVRSAAAQKVSAPRPDTLVQLYLEIAEAKFVRRDTIPLAEATVAQYMVVTPNGRPEDREQAIRGVRNFRVDSISLTEAEVHRRVDAAVLVARLALHGELHAQLPDGRPLRADLTGPYRALAVFVAVGGDWRLGPSRSRPFRIRSGRLGRAVGFRNTTAAYSPIARGVPS